ncbi:MAG: hypothetical protein ACM3RP_10240 [Chitinophagales bacterium]
MKRMAQLVLKVIALAFVMLVGFAVTSPLLGASAKPTPEMLAAARLTPLVCLLMSAALAHPILRSRWYGWKLAAAIFFVLYGLMTVITQVETYYFLSLAPLLPPGMLPRLFVTGALISALWAPVAVWLLGRWSPPGGKAVPVPVLRLKMSLDELIAKTFLIGLVYLVLYFTFGYYVAWKNPAVQAYYHGTDPGSFLLQLKHAFTKTPELIPFQLLRSVMWVAFALPVIHLMKGEWWEAGLAVALLYTVLVSAQLLLPNPYMPSAVRIAHLLETATSDFIFGWAVVLILGWKDKLPEQ